MNLSQNMRMPTIDFNRFVRRFQTNLTLKGMFQLEISESIRKYHKIYKKSAVLLASKYLGG